jgi:hypothetical protein
MYTWKYADMWEWYRDDRGGLFTPTSDVVVHIYNANYPVIKFRTPRQGDHQVEGVDVGPSEPFLQRHCRAATIPASLSASAPHGAFVVIEDPTSHAAIASANRSKNLYFVFPSVYENFGIVAADHFSFCVNSKDPAWPIRLHLTEYQPRLRNPSVGSVLHHKNYLPATMEDLPATDFPAFRSRVVRNPNLTDNAATLKVVEDLMKLMAVPFVHPVAGTVGGGAGRRGRRQRQRQRQAAAASAAGLDEFEQLWYRLPLRKVVVFGVPHGPRVHFTAHVYDRMNHRPGIVATKGFHFVVERSHAHDEGLVRAEVAKRLQGYIWDDFIDPKPHEVA